MLNAIAILPFDGARFVHFLLGPATVAFSGLAMGLNGLATELMLPAVVSALGLGAS